MMGKQFRALIKLSLLELYRRKDLVVVLLLSFVLMVPLALLQPFGVKGASRYMNEIAMLLIWIFSIVISLGVSSRLFAPEFESRTIYPMLAKPVGHGVLLFGKYLGALVASISTLILFYLLYALLSGLHDGVWFPPIMIQAFFLHVGFVVMLCALGLLGSLVMTPSASMTICGVVVASMLLYGRKLPDLIATTPAPLKWVVALFHAIGPHFEFFDMRQRMVHGWGMVSWRVCGLVLLYALCYAGICLLLARLAFKRKKL